MRRRTHEEYVQELIERNPSIELVNKYINSKTKVTYKCKNCGYIGSSYPNNLLNGTQCRNCRLVKMGQSMRMTQSEFQERLKLSRPDLEALDLYSGNRTDISFRCKICGYKWETAPDIVFRSKQCPVCSHKKELTHKEFVDRLKTINPNIQPMGEIVSTKDPIRCRCLLCGTLWSSFPYNLLRGSGCPTCAREKSSIGRHITAVEKNNFALNYPDIAAEWDYSKNGNKKPEDYSSGSDAMVWWICPVGHHYPAKINDRTQNRHGNGCSQCNYRYHTSFPEQALYYYIKQCYSDAISSYKSKERFVFDIFIPSLNIAIEYDGRYWHENERAKERDQRKYNYCQENDIKLIRVQECFDCNNVGAFCNLAIISEYTRSDFGGLDICICNVLEELLVTLDVDTKRDAIQIKKQYYDSLPKNSLAHIYPNLANEWDYDKNDGLSPYMFTPGSQDKVYWRCEHGHSYLAQISSRVRGTGCPKCQNRNKTAEVFRTQMLSINSNIEIIGDYVNNRTRISCKCKLCGHEWNPTPNTLLDKHGCPICANNARAKYKSEYHRKKKAN